MMKLVGQRWEYRVGNHLIHVDNAYSSTGWSQERLVVNLETVQERGGWFHFLRLFSEPWFSSLGEEDLTVVLRAGLLRISSTVKVGDLIIEPERQIGAEWNGESSSWPLDEHWR